MMPLACNESRCPGLDIGFGLGLRDVTMTDRDNQRHVTIDQRTSREITRGIGDALRRSMGHSQHSDRLQILLEAFKRQDEESAAKPKGK